MKSKNITKARTLSVAQMVSPDTDADLYNVYGDLERIIDAMVCPGCSPIDAAENLIRLMVLLDTAEANGKGGIYREVITDYAYLRTEHKSQSLKQLKVSLSQDDEVK
jgi:hypothetical protein